VAGTGTEPYEDQGGKDKHHEGGHMFAVILPFTTFIRAITGEDPTKEHIEAFRARFGVAPVMNHTKPAILESIYYATPFYSDHHAVGKKKRDALATMRRWLEEKGEGHYDWNNYAMMHVMGKKHIGQGTAYRLFTEAHLYVFPPPPSPPSSGGNGRGGGGLRYSLPSSPLSGGNGTSTPCRSFLFYQPNKITEDGFYGELFSRYVPEDITDKAEAAHYMEELNQDLARMWSRVSISQGYGLPIELLAHGRQVYHGKPLFRLVATMEMPEPTVELDRMMWRAYERPVVPLQARQVDLFAEEPDWMSSILPHKGGRGIRDTNRRVILYVYDIVRELQYHCVNTRLSVDMKKDLKRWREDMEDLRKALGARRYVVKKYKWCVACIFEI
jgi:hypothetical protein